MNELQTQTDQLLKALAQLHDDNFKISVALCGIAVLIAALVIITIAKR